MTGHREHRSCYSRARRLAADRSSNTLIHFHLGGSSGDAEQHRTTDDIKASGSKCGIDRFSAYPSERRLQSRSLLLVSVGISTSSSASRRAPRTSRFAALRVLLDAMLKSPPVGWPSFDRDPRSKPRDRARSACCRLDFRQATCRPQSFGARTTLRVRPARVRSYDVPVQTLCRDCGEQPPPYAQVCPACASARVMRHPELHEPAIAHLDCGGFRGRSRRIEYLAADPPGDRGAATRALRRAAALSNKG